MPRTLLITGASNGLGAALARRYAAPGITLGLLGRNRECMAQVAQDCHAQGATVISGLFDITDTATLHAWITDFDDHTPVDLVIANAGITSQIGSHGENETLDSIHQLLAINLHAAINTIHPLLERMRQRGQGQIALVSSLAAYRGMPVTPAYSASKAAIKSYGEALRGWLRAEGIRVNVICPGFIQSAMSDRFPGKRPFMLSSTQAADIVVRGLEKNQAIIAFPFPLNLGMWLLGVLPFPLASFFMGLSGYNQVRAPRP